MQANIERGMSHGAKVILKEEGDQEDSDKKAGDVIIVVLEAKHEIFERKGLHLYTTMSVSIKKDQNPIIQIFIIDIQEYDIQEVIFRCSLS